MLGNLVSRKEQPKVPTVPSAWQMISEMYSCIELFILLLVQFPLYILSKLGITNIIPTLLSVNSILGPACLVVGVTSVACSVGIGLGVGLGVGLTCNNDSNNGSINGNTTNTTSPPFVFVTAGFG